MKQVFVQKIVDGIPKGRKRKLEIAQDEIVFDLLEKSSSILNFSDDSRLIIQCDNQILNETQSLNAVDEWVSKQAFGRRMAVRIVIFGSMSRKVGHQHLVDDECSKYVRIHYSDPTCNR